MQKRTLNFICLFSLMLFVSGTNYAQTYSLKSLSKVQQQALVEKLNSVLQVYRETTGKVLSQITSHPENFSDDTSLELFWSLFELEAYPLDEVLDDNYFAEGRSDHDITWLKKSFSDLNSALTTSKKFLQGKEPLGALNNHITIINFDNSEDYSVVEATIPAASRKFCGLYFLMETDKITNETTISANDICP